MKTLIVFAKTPVEGKVKTRLASAIGRAAALEIHRAMLADTTTMLTGFKGAVKWWTDTNPEMLAGELATDAKIEIQCEGDLGQRMEHAFETEFSRTDGPLAIIGTDCPMMTVEALDKLLACVEDEAEVAVIPTEDGGYAALAMKNNCPEVFDRIRWSTPHTLVDTLERLHSAGKKVVLHPKMADIDNLCDLERYAAGELGKPPTHLAATLRKLGWRGGKQTVVTDDLGFHVQINPTPERIVSLIPSVTEALFDLGLGARVVGRTDYCISPAEKVPHIPTVGGPKTFIVEAVEALTPDLVIADAEENDKERVERLMHDGIRVFVALPRTLGDVSAFLRRIGILCQASEKAEVAATRLDEISPPEKQQAALCMIWNDPPMIVAPGTLTASLMGAAGLKCVSPNGKKGSYPVVNHAEIGKLSPRVLLLPSEPWPFTREEAGTLQKNLPDTAVLMIPGEWLTWYGVKTSENIENLKEVVKSTRSGGILEIA